MVIVVMYACAITCGQSFTVLSIWGILISFWSVLVFSPILLSLFIIITALLLLLSLFLLLLLVIAVIIISTELLALCDVCCVTGLGMVGGARGWVAVRAGLWGALATWVWGQQLQPPCSGHPTSICEAGVKSVFNGSWLMQC